MKDNLIHGGDWVGYMKKYGREALDFSANVSPLGLPDSLREAAIKSLETLDRYPDPLSRRLRAALAGDYGISPECFIVGSGAADIVYRLVTAVKPKNALVTAPTFAEYEEALSTIGCKVKHHTLKEDDGFRINDDILEIIDNSLDMVFLCEPNNPTGVTTDRGLLMRILERAKEYNVRVLVDECFNDFLDEPEKHSLVDCINYYDNLIILKSFTKMYAMAGARLGYAISSDAGLIEKMRIVTQAWPVSSIAEEMGIAALGEKDYRYKVRELTMIEKTYLLNELEALADKVIFGEANYLLFKTRKGLKEDLMKKGIMIRGCDNYNGLDGHWYRIGVRTHDDNMKLIEAIKEEL